MKVSKAKKRRGRVGTFADVFDARIESIRQRLEASGASWAELCTLAKVSRAQPVRWSAETPKTIKLVDQLEAALIQIEKRRA